MINMNIVPTTGLNWGITAAKFLLADYDGMRVELPPTMDSPATSQSTPSGNISLQFFSLRLCI